MSISFNNIASGPWGSYLIEETDRLWTLVIRRDGYTENVVLVWKDPEGRAVTRMIAALVETGVPLEMILNED